MEVVVNAVVRRSGLSWARVFGPTAGNIAGANCLTHQKSIVPQAPTEFEPHPVVPRACLATEEMGRKAETVKVPGYPTRDIAATGPLHREGWA